VNSSDPREQVLAQQIFLRCRSVAYELEAAESLHGLSDSDFVGTVAMLPSRVAMGARGGQAATLALADLRERQDLAHPRPLKWQAWDRGAATDGYASGGGGSGKVGGGGKGGGGKGGNRAKKK
jgi:hypothetical protein